MCSYVSGLGELTRYSNPIEINSMQLNPSWVGNMSSTIQEISLILWNAKVYNQIYKSLPTVPSLSQINPFHSPTQFLKNPF